MKIISSFKDYYDYLKGIYGEDPKLVLDRREFHKIPYTRHHVVETFYLADYMIQGYWWKDKIYFGEEVRQFSIEKKYWGLYSPNKEENYAIKNGVYMYEYCLKKPIVIKNSPTYKENCPILRMVGKEYHKHPILKEYGFIRVFKPEEIWIILSEWLGKVVTMNEKQVPIGDDKTRILSHGFDLKTSFRH